MRIWLRTAALGVIGPMPDRFRCCSCSHEWEQQPSPWMQTLDVPDPKYKPRLLGYSRAAGDCPKCGSFYAEWLTKPGD